MKRNWKIGVETTHLLLQRDVACSTGLRRKLYKVKLNLFKWWNGLS